MADMSDMAQDARPAPCEEPVPYLALTTYGAGDNQAAYDAFLRTSPRSFLEYADVVAENIRGSAMMAKVSSLMGILWLHYNHVRIACPVTAHPVALGGETGGRAGSGPFSGTNPRERNATRVFVPYDLDCIRGVLCLVPDAWEEMHFPHESYDYWPEGPEGKPESVAHIGRRIVAVEEMAENFTEARRSMSDASNDLGGYPAALCAPENVNALRALLSLLGGEDG